MFVFLAKYAIQTSEVWINAIALQQGRRAVARWGLSEYNWDVAGVYLFTATNQKTIQLSELDNGSKYF